MLEKYLKLWTARLPRKLKSLLVVLMDVIISIISVWVAFYLRTHEMLPIWKQYNEYYPLPACIVATFIALLIFNFFNIYKVLYRYIGSFTMIKLAKACTLYGIIYGIIFTLIGVDGVPRSIGIIQPLLFFILIGFSRFITVYFLGNIYFNGVPSSQKKQALIYGANKDGYQISRILFQNRTINIIGYLDENTSLHGKQINNLTIYDPNDIDRLIKKYDVSEIIFILNEQKVDYKKMLERLKGKKINFLTLPNSEILAQGNVKIDRLRELSIEDVLGRNPIQPNPKLMKHDITNKNVLVTGAGGSIGSELCRQVFSQKPKKLILLDHSEIALYNIVNELKKYNISDKKINIITSLCSVTDKKTVENLLKITKPDTIFHAAAYKHVSLVEENKIEGINNNVYGTLILSQLAIDFSIKKFVLISSDKAVRPSGVMGASKRFAEMIIQSLSKTKSRTLFAIVRFGNVLGSSGSVIPLFKSQIKMGGPVTVTHQDITRYFMTIKEAAQLVIQAGAMTTKKQKQSKFAPIYILDMGQPIKILDLAKLMINLSGLNFKYEENDGEIEIKIIGLHPAEKLYEELAISENFKESIHPKIKYVNETYILWPKMKKHLLIIEKLINERDEKNIKNYVFDIIS